MPGIGDIDVSAAAAAIDAQGGIDTVLSEAHQRGEVTTPVVEPQTAATPQVNQPSTQATQYERDPHTGQFVAKQAPAQESIVDETETFWNGDPNTLPAEVQPVYKQLQADYTRKTQELATQRKQFESMGDLGTVAEAVQLYQSLQDPNYWPQLYNELKDGMEKMGLTPQEAAVAAGTEVQRQQAATPSDPFASLDDEFAPIKEAYSSMKSELEQMKSQWEAQKERDRQEQLQAALVGELTRQENFIRQNNPTYTDEDIQAIYELSSFHNGNLIQAQQRYEAIMADRLQRYLDSKGSAVQQHGLPMPGTQSLPEKASTFKNLDEAHLAAMERLRMMEAEDNL